MAKPPQHFSLDSARIAEFLKLWGVGAKKHEVNPGIETRRQCLEISGESRADGLGKSKHDEQ
jgi:hypothetical protein